MPKSFASFSFGCRLNQAELEMLNRQLLSLGFIRNRLNPDIYLINTCAVTAKAEREARQMIYSLRKKLPETKIVVTGCAATKWINEKVKMEEADWLLDNTSKEFAAQLIAKKFKDEMLTRESNEGRERRRNELTENEWVMRGGEPQNGFPFKSSFGAAERQDPRGKALETEFGQTDKFIASGRLFLKIQDGCQRFCTFCIVPYLRGQPKSKSIQTLVDQIKDVEKEISEVILTAINTQAFGYDSGESFITLLNTIFNRTKIARVSFGSIHPWSINDEFFNFYKSARNLNRLVKFFHIPLQSGSDKILTLMKRGYTRKEFLVKLKAIEDIDPFTLIGTDIIAGFLEETDKDFEDTYNFLNESPVSKFHVFRFNRRERTAAYYMAKRLDEPSPSVKKKRAKALQELSNRKYGKFLSKHLDKKFSALFLERRTDGFQEVLLDNQIPAYIKSPENHSGRIKNVLIDDLKNGKLRGRII